MDKWLGWIHAAIVALRGLFGRNRKPVFFGIILPATVRQALNAQNGQLFQKDLRVLASCEWGFAVVVFYLLIKMLHGQRNFQRELLAEMSVCAIRGPETRGLVRAWIDQLDPEWSVAAAKIVQLNRQGFEMWDDRYRDAIGHCAEQGLPLVFVAYAPLVGFRWAVKLYQSTGQEIFVVSHLLVNDPAATYCGYRIWWKNEEPNVDVLDNKFSWPDAVIVLEDTVKHGTTLRAVKDYLLTRRSDMQIQEVVLSRV